MKKIVIASDHAGVSLKRFVIAKLEEKGDEVVNLGTDDNKSVDYPDYAKKLADHIKKHPDFIGVLICGTGVGISIAANRYKHIRAALCSNAEIAELARAHNDANVLVLGARTIDEKSALKILEIFLKTKFSGGRHSARVAKLS
jgi:ribose 5-phosphate isomerase B